MDFVQTANKAEDLFGLDKHGFSAGNPTGGVLATKLSADWCNGVQQELINIIEAAGLAPTQSRLNQVAIAIQSGALMLATAAGTVDAITATLSPVPDGLADGMKICVRAAGANTIANPTLDVNGLGAKPIVKADGTTALLAGDIIGAGHWLELQYDSTLDLWILQNPAMSFIQSGAASVARTVQEKLREWVSIADKGASTSASGATNSAAIQAAIDEVSAAGGGTVFVPAGTFLLDVVNYVKDDGATVFGATCFKMKDNVHLKGVGSTSVLKVKNGAYGVGAFFRVISSRDATRLFNAKISNITIDGNKDNQIASTQCSNIVLECLGSVEVEGVRSINANGNAIMLRGTTSSYASNIAIRNCIVTNATSIGIQSSQFYGLVISGNLISGTNDNCIDIYGEDGTTTCHGMSFSITGNICQAGLVGVFLETVRNGTVSGNDITACTFGVTVNRINGEPHGINIVGNSTYACQYGVRVTGDTGGVSIRGNSFHGFSVAGGQLGDGGNWSYVDVSDNYLTPATNTVAIIRAAGRTVSFCTARFNTVNSNGIAAGLLFFNIATSTVATYVNSFRVIPGQVGRDLYGSDAEFAALNATTGTVTTLNSTTSSLGSASLTNLTSLSGVANNTAGPFDIAITDGTGGLLYVTGVQSGVGTSTWIVPFVKRGGTLVLGTAQKAILTADPITGIAVSSGSARVSCLAANTYLRYAVHYVPTY